LILFTLRVKFGSDMSSEIDFGAVYDSVLARRWEEDQEGDTRYMGWNFLAGDPEIFLHSDRLVVPGGKALDIGTGFVLRNSLWLAENGMQVDAIDTSEYVMEVNRDFLQFLEERYPLVGDPEKFRRADPKLPITLQVLNAARDELGVGVYDTVILSNTLIHTANKQEALNVLMKAVGAVKDGGHLWVRAAGIMDSSYDQMYMQASYSRGVITMPDVYTFESLGMHDGHANTLVFFDQHELIQIFSKLGMRIIHSQVAPTPGIELTEGERQQFSHLAGDYKSRMGLSKQAYRASTEALEVYKREQYRVRSWGRENIMYGENWNKGNAREQGSGTVSVLVQKGPRNPVVNISVA
jgi:SAM-dependent methyltransferase